MRLGDLDALRDEVDTWGCNDYDKYDFLEALDNAPTVELDEVTELGREITNIIKDIMPQILEIAKNNIRPQGEWKLHGMIYYCSVCGHDYEQGGNNFCGNCGAKMIRDFAEEEQHDI